MANGTYGDTAYNPLVGYTDGLRKNYDNKNWVFYGPRRYKGTWIFDYSNMQQVFADGQLRYYGTYNNGSRIQNYEYSTVFVDTLPIPDTGVDAGGPFLSRPVDQADVDYGVFGPAPGETTSPDEDLLNKPPNNYNRVTVERQCFTPRPGVPSPSSTTMAPGLPFIPYVAVRSDAISMLIGSTITGDADIINCSLLLNRQSDNWNNWGGSGYNEPYSSYEGELAQDMAIFAVNVTGVYTGQNRPGEFYLKVPVTFVSDTYIARIEYNGATGIVKGYINNIEVISCTTGQIVSKSRYQAEVQAFTRRQHQGSYYDPEHIENPPAQPPLKLYQVTSTFT
jgi:hypothetical protein